MGNTIQIKRGTTAGSTLADGELGLVRTSTAGNEELYVGNGETDANVKVGGYQVGQFDNCISISTNSESKKEITTSSNAIPIFSSPVYLGNNFALKVANGSDTADTGATSITPGVQNFEGTPVISIKAEHNDSPNFALGIGTHPTLVEGKNKIVIGNIDAIEVGADSIVCLDTCALTVEGDISVGGNTTLSGTTSIATPLNINPNQDAAVLQVTGANSTLNIVAPGGVSINGELYPPEVETFPIGMVTPYAGLSAPSGWLMCDGTAISRDDYANLYIVIGTTYGEGNGSTTFNLPNLQGRVPMGVSSTYTLAATGGAETVTLSISEMPSHSHSFKGGSHTFFWGETAAVSNVYLDGAIATSGTTEGNAAMTSQNIWTGTNSSGSGGAHNNMQPYLAINYIIKY